MTEPTDALLPCPFCGEAAKHSFNSLYGDMSMASCKSCGATAYAPKWNRRAVLAKWGQPVVAGDVDRADAVNLARNALTQYDCAITKKGVRVLAEAVLSMDYALTTPQPTQAQADAREPLTNEHIRAMLNKHPPEDVCGWSYRMGIDDAELHHGIKGG